MMSSVRTTPTNGASLGARDARRAQLQELARTQLLDAAETVFGDKGVRAATIKEIAELAEFSVGSVYLTFESKDDLLIGVMARRGEEMIDGMRAVFAQPIAPLDRLVALACYQVGFFRDRPAFARLYLRSSAIGPLIPDVARARDLEENMHRVIVPMEALIAEGQAAGQVCGGPPATLCRLLSGLVLAYQATEVARAADAPTDLSLEEFAALVRRTFALVPTNN